EAHHDLMRLLAAAGQPEAALRQYLELERLLDQELGEVPEEGSRELARQIKQQPRPVPRQQEDGSSPAVSHGDGASLPGGPAERPRPAPIGTFTFLLTEFARSSTPRDPAGEAFQAALSSCHAIWRSAFGGHHGQELRHTEDSLLGA